MPKLPVTVTNVQRLGGGTWGVTVAFFDGTTANYMVPDTLATVEAVTISALAMAVLSDRMGPGWSGPHSKHRRYAPRTST